jgi:BirA family biotin operon repressor/biotin-[acetyl-CoA-carboxylase] ligase
MNPINRWQLDTRRIGKNVLVFDRVASTNSSAAELAGDSANDGVVILANEQTMGRGQHGRSWHCPPGGGVLMSALLFPPPELRRPAILTAWAAVSVCEVILRTTKLQAKIKWPNDVLIRGKKVCGILIEQGQGTVVGIGLNVNQPAEAFQQSGLENGTSLSLGAGRQFECATVARQIICQLDDEYDRLCTGDLATLESCWKWRLGLLGKHVSAECIDGTYHGRLLDAGWDGLQLELPSREMLRLQPETVRQLGES